ncbi:hypothetical protein D3C86_1712990 [compost metagenome]
MLVPLAAGIAGVVFAFIRAADLIPGHHPCPFLIHVNIIGEVNGIRHPRTGRPHIYFKRNNPSVFVRFEQLDMEETFPDVKSLQNASSGFLNLRTNVLQAEIIEVVVRIHDVHDAVLEQMADGEPDFSVSINQTIIGENHPVDKFLNNKRDISRLVIKKVLQLSFVTDLEGVAGP